MDIIGLPLPQHYTDEKTIPNITKRKKTLVVTPPPASHKDVHC